MTESKLKVCWSLKARIDDEKARLQELRNLATSITAEIDGLPKSKNISSKVERITAAIVDTENLIQQLITIKGECSLELNQQLAASGIDAVTRQVLFCRYGLCMLFRDIGISIGYSERRVYSLHSAGLAALNISE